MPSYPTDAARALESAVVLADRSRRPRLRIEGDDRAKFLHNLTTNEVKRRGPGSGCEAFVTNPQGKALAFVTLLVMDEAILLRTEPEATAALLPHLRKYGVLDAVELVEATEETFEHHLAGPGTDDLLKALGIDDPPDKELDHGVATVAGAAVRLVRESPLGAVGVTILGEAKDAEAVVAAIREAGAGYGLVAIDSAAFDALRIEAGTPASGRDVTERNLPQEVDRDARAISFVKGCYLGQETVARLDALGHVNRILRGFEIGAEAPPPDGSKLVDGDKEVGWIGSAALSERTGRPVALGYVRVGLAKDGAAVVVRPEGGSEATATVRTLPIRP